MRRAREVWGLRWPHGELTASGAWRFRRVVRNSTAWFVGDMLTASSAWRFRCVVRSSMAWLVGDMLSVSGAWRFRRDFGGGRAS